MTQLKQVTCAIELQKCKQREEWDMCVDGVWYAMNVEMDSSDFAELSIIIKEKNLEIKEIPFWNCTPDVVHMGYKQMVYLDSETAYLIKFED